MKNIITFLLIVLLWLSTMLFVLKVQGDCLKRDVEMAQQIGGLTEVDTGILVITQKLIDLYKTK